MMADDTNPPTPGAKPRKATARKPTAKRAAPKAAAAKRANPKPRAKAAPRAAAKSTADKVRDTLNDRIVKPARDAAESVRETLSNAGAQGSGFGLKMIEQAEHNAREAFNAMRAAAKAKDVSEVLKVQGEYLREQGARSLAQAREVGDLIAQFGRDAIAPLTGNRKK